jgi:hypothetical protein
LLEDQTAAPTHGSLTTIASVSSAVIVEVFGLQKITVTINGGLAISAASAEESHDAIRRHCGSAERNRGTSVREDASDSKNDGGKRNQLGHKGPLTVKLSGRPLQFDKRSEQTTSLCARGAPSLTHHGRSSVS